VGEPTSPRSIGVAGSSDLTVSTGNALAKLASMRPAVMEEEKEEVRPSRPVIAA